MHRTVAPWLALVPFADEPHHRLAHERCRRPALLRALHLEGRGIASAGRGEVEIEAVDAEPADAIEDVPRQPDLLDRADAVVLTADRRLRHALDDARHPLHQADAE